MPTVDFEPWRRYHDDKTDPHVPSPLRHYYPSSREDLIAIVNEAEALTRTTGRQIEVRASGSHWALSEAAVTNDFIVDPQDPVSGGGDPRQPPPARLNRTLYDVVPGCMNLRALNFFQFQGVTPYDVDDPVDPSKFYLYHVEAGTRIYELYCRLDAGDDLEPKSLARMWGPFHAYQGPWALPTLGGAGGQTIVGALSTGTHGGDVHVPPIADAVQAIHLIGPEGKEYWIDRELAPSTILVDETKLEALYPGINIVWDDDIFRSVLVSMGRMGIIYSVVLRVIRQYALHENRVDKDGWSNVQKWIGNPAHPNFGTPTSGNRFVQVVVNPNADADNKDHSCWATFRDSHLAGAPPGTLLPIGFTSGPGILGRKDRCLNGNAGNSYPLQDPSSGFLDKTATSFFNKMCASDKPVRDQLISMRDDAETTRDAALATAAAAELAIEALLTPPPMIPLLEEARDAALATAAAAEILILFLNHLTAIVAPGPLFNTLASIANDCAANDRMDVFRRIADTAIGFDQGKRDLTAISYAIMDVHNYLDINCTSSGDSLEVFFDFSTAAAAKNVVDYLNRIFQNNVDLNNGALPSGDPALDGKRLAFPGYISMRFMSRSSALLAMQKWPTVCSFEMAAPLAALGTEPFLKAAERDALKMGGAVHWGQRNNLAMRDVERLYGNFSLTDPLFRWRKTLAHFSHHGRVATFSTPWTRSRGLEVVEPQVRSFKTVPTNACAGELVHIDWDAFDNPPDTVVNLEVLPPDSSTPVSVIPLAGLSGADNVPMPAGRKVFRLAASLTVSGRTLTGGQTMDVHGFHSGDIWPFVLTAECLSVDGKSRWGVLLSFATTVSSSLAVEGVICDFFGVTTAWYLRRAGIPDVKFTPAATQVSLAAEPKLQGDWVFFVEDVGCSGTAPEAHVQLQMVCGS